MPPPPPPEPAWEPLVWVTTAGDSGLGLGAAAAPLEEVVTGGAAEGIEGEEPAEEAAVVTPPIGSVVVWVVR